MEPTHVGLILDSSVVIAGERAGRTVREILKQIQLAYGEIEIGLSVARRRARWNRSAPAAAAVLRR